MRSGVDTPLSRSHDMGTGSGEEPLAERLFRSP
jgi:hypothetical protein